PPPCGHPAPTLLVLVASAPAHAEQRQAVRDTWGAGVAAVRTLFVVGLPASPSLQAALVHEAAAHGDLL
ncbi:B3GN8 acetylglucosaminyltransferase, partial [Crypturellus undulatus]|nr:B3GN8 acetylglucosaminyltransferase [Crypturellus undulatus]